MAYSWAMGIDGEEHGEKINWHDSYDMLIRGKKSFIESVGRKVICSMPFS